MLIMVHFAPNYQFWDLPLTLRPSVNIPEWGPVKGEEGADYDLFVIFTLSSFYYQDKFVRSFWQNNLIL